MHTNYIPNSGFKMQGVELVGLIMVPILKTLPVHLHEILMM